MTTEDDRQRAERRAHQERLNRLDKRFPDAPVSKDLSQFDACGERISHAWKSAMKQCPPQFYNAAWDIFASVFYNGVVSGLQTGTRCNEEQSATLVEMLKQINAKIEARKT